MTRPTTRFVTWTGAEDDPARLESATLSLADSRLTARGTSRASSYAVAWSLTTGDAWVTRRLDLSVHGDGWSRTLALVRDDAGWTGTGAAHGSGGPQSPPGLADPDSVAEALDCDIALCPVTNTMPVLRHGLVSNGPGPEIPHVMAWVDVPSLTVIRSDQIYRALTPYDADGHAVVRYASASRDFVGDLTVDVDGIVVDYPELAYRASVTSAVR
ncbi:putative glycolipid-binding domain-containing protein [Mumia sp. zg.B17]|uniref:putative glycolipid-binding domain-containing protein n=1 Tax=unclassified Mumia TaxID=2621872 RepID=UPI001C6F08DA|nr:MULTISPECIES: putative glycolipid-binding domain-containing protein [unclassified Mumia]MBW9207736.1 putative glycolipid-binding domain-containing protein [Mumia sp. zg.B17]MDD9350162.1 putative glycolipid-binding domain-containing protein [Mumia sp.]